LLAPLLQLAVEEYFTSSGALPVPIYWLGANRTSKTSPFAWYPLNATIGVIPNDDPYIHWNWFYPNRRVLEYHCALARWAEGCACSQQPAALVQRARSLTGWPPECFVHEACGALPCLGCSGALPHTLLAL
jgi:hypothetical protein